jgi:uncharacterized protein YneF (UPF0154 family)
VNRKLLLLLVVLSLLVLAVGFFVDGPAYLQMSSQNPPLTHSKIAEVRKYIGEFIDYLKDGEDVYDEFDTDEMLESV